MQTLHNSTKDALWPANLDLQYHSPKEFILKNSNMAFKTNLYSERIASGDEIKPGRYQLNKVSLFNQTNN